MPILGGELGTRVLTKLFPGLPSTMNGSAYRNRSKLETLLGQDVWQAIQGKVVIDFGCGTGAEAAEMARRGATQVYGIDIQEKLLAIARQSCPVPNLSFGRTAPDSADTIISLDCFEHFGNPEQALREMSVMLKPGGEVWTSFGPTWYHPLGGHLFSVFPWAHLVFSEQALCNWRKSFKSDGANRFCEVEGGLNQMSIKRFLRIVKTSPLAIKKLELVPIRHMKWLHSSLTREFFTATVRCRLVRRAQQ
jgi:SAM-dependent methyltransferase